MKRVLIILVLILVGLFFVRFVIGGPEDTWICDDDTGEYIKHGNPKAPMPTGGCGRETQKEANQEEVCVSGSGKEMPFSQALQIAEKKCKDGNLKETHFCNPNSGTWWIDFTPSEPKEGCNPACVVFVDSGETEINWRCTGLIPPK